MGGLLRVLLVAGAGALGYNRMTAGNDEKPQSKLIRPAVMITSGVISYLIIKKLK